MRGHLGRLEHMALHEQLRFRGGQCPACAAQSRRGGGCDCGGTCPSCGGGHGFDAFEAARARRRATPATPRPAPRATPAQRGGGPVGRWRGWTAPVTMQQLIDARRRFGTGRLTPTQLRQVPAALRPFLRPGVNLYRMTIPQGQGPGYLSIGMTQGRAQTVAGRARQHYRVSSSGEPHLHRRMNPRGRPLDPSRILVQAGGIPGGMTPRMAHLYEIWLQHRERVSDWPLIRDTRTFEDEAFADLVAGTATQPRQRSR